MWPSHCGAFAITWWMARHLSAASIVPFLTSRCSVTFWVGCRRKTERKPAGDSRHEVSTERSSRLWTLAALASAVFWHSGRDSLPSSGSTESKTLPLCCWFKYFPEQQLQEPGVAFAMNPTRREKCSQRNIRLKNNHCECEIIKG